MANIYELSSNYRELQKLMEQAETAEEVEAIRNTMAGMTGEIGDVIESLLKAKANILGDVPALSLEISRLAHRAGQLQTSAAAIDEQVKYLMEMAKAKTMRTALFTVTLAEGSESVEILDEAQLPEDMLSVTTAIKPDKKAIKAAIKSGREVPGAAMKRGEKSLRIR